jgi:hypothetical protein
MNHEVAATLTYSHEPSTQEWLVFGVAVAEVDFIEGLPFEAGLPVWGCGAVFPALFAGRYFFEPFPVEREV